MINYSEHLNQTMLILDLFCLYDVGMESFRGPILHSHQFKDPKNYKDMNILLIGSSMAAHDIGAHCLKDGAQSLTFSYRSPQEGYKILSCNFFHSHLKVSYSYNFCY
jgi:hypothetical protein